MILADEVTVSAKNQNGQQKLAVLIMLFAKI